MGLDSVELVIAIEQHFGIEISDEEAGAMQTPGDVYEYVLEALAKKRNAVTPELAKEVVWKQIVEIVVAQLGVKEEKVTYDSNFVKDLGMS